MGWSDDLWDVCRGLYAPGKNPRPHRALSAECLAGVVRGEGSLQSVVNRLWWSGREHSHVLEMARSQKWRGLRRLAEGDKPRRWEQALLRSWNAAAESAEAWLSARPERSADPAVAVATAVWWAGVEAVTWPASGRASCEAICRVFGHKAVELNATEFDLSVREIANRAHRAERTIRSRLLDVKAAGVVEVVRVGARWSTAATRWRLTQSRRSNDIVAAHTFTAPPSADPESVNAEGVSEEWVRPESGVRRVSESGRTTASRSWAWPLPDPAADVFSHGALNASGRALYEVLGAGEPLTTSDAAEVAGLTLRTAQRALNRLASAGLAERVGARWRALPCAEWVLLAQRLGVAGRATRREQRHQAQRAAWQLRLTTRQRELGSRDFPMLETVGAPGDEVERLPPPDAPLVEEDPPDGLPADYERLELSAYPPAHPPGGRSGVAAAWTVLNQAMSGVTDLGEGTRLQPAAPTAAPDRAGARTLARIPETRECAPKRFQGASNGPDDRPDPTGRPGEPFSVVPCPDVEEDPASEPDTWDPTDAFAPGAEWGPELVAWWRDEWADPHAQPGSLWETGPAEPDHSPTVPVRGDAEVDTAEVEVRPGHAGGHASGDALSASPFLESLVEFGKFIIAQAVDSHVNRRVGTDQPKVVESGQVSTAPIRPEPCGHVVEAGRTAGAGGRVGGAIDREPGVQGSSYSACGYPARAAAEYLGISVSAFRRLRLPAESRARHRRWRREVLDGHLACTPRRGRGRPRTYPSWTDEQGVSRPLSAHPNFHVVRAVVQRLPEEWPPERICAEWRDDLAAAVFGVTAVIGVRPSRHHRLETVEPGQLLAPESVLWWRPWPNSLRARYAVMRRAMPRERGVRCSAPSVPAPSFEARLPLRRHAAAAQRGGEARDGCDDTWLYERLVYEEARVLQMPHLRPPSRVGGSDTKK